MQNKDEVTCSLTEIQESELCKLVSLTRIDEQNCVYVHKYKVCHLLKMPEDLGDDD